MWRKYVKKILMLKSGNKLLNTLQYFFEIEQRKAVEKTFIMILFYFNPDCALSAVFHNVILRKK